MDEGAEEMWKPAIKPAENIGWKGDRPTEVVRKAFDNGIVKPGDKVLDIGCGFGRNANWLATQGAEVTAINISDEEIRQARLKAGEAGLNVNYVHTDAVSLPFAEEYFGVALDLGCSHMISTREGQEKAEKEAARVLKPGGYLVYFGFSKEHPSYIKNQNSPMYRNLEDIKRMYGNDFEIMSHEETRWQPKPEEKSNVNEHVGLNVIMRRK
jgi:ubiquinone/menaquinone biosynthesis C-methylase UbiE